MDPSKHHFSKEGCSSSESGWTMYIASPMQEDDNECSDHVTYENDHNTIAKDGNYDDDNNDNEPDSDDSMTSDASSGPHRPYKQERGRGSSGAASFKHDNHSNFNHCSSATKLNKKEKKNDGNGAENNRRFTTNRKYSK